MKKLFILVLIIVSLTGCSLSNTPTSKTEELFSKYQRLDDEIKNEIEDILENETLTSEQKNRYRDLIEKQYKNLTFEIKDEKIDGDTAVVTVQIEVLDYRKAISELNTDENTSFDILVYNNQKLNKLESVKDKVAYTLEIEVTKDSDGNWRINSLSSDEIKKIQGMY